MSTNLNSNHIIHWFKTKSTHFYVFENVFYMKTNKFPDHENKLFHGIAFEVIGETIKKFRERVIRINDMYVCVSIKLV